MLLFGFVFSLQAQAESNQKQDVSAIHLTIDKDKIHNLIEHHVDAIRTRDATKAYDLITLRGQEKYGTPKLYWRDVRKNMRLLFSHASYEFLGQNTVKNTIIQKVNMIDHDGKHHLVIFRVKKDINQDWRIENVIITTKDDNLA